ncbi:hypothetical protein FB451DRAFT_1182526 [Mycena latifolia]|nr:hypothetical protein FB451DRAFT_1182526 [Mycena latifolia]
MVHTPIPQSDVQDAVNTGTRLVRRFLGIKDSDTFTPILYLAQMSPRRHHRYIVISSSSYGVLFQVEVFASAPTWGEELDLHVQDRKANDRSPTCFDSEYTDYNMSQGTGAPRCLFQLPAPVPPPQEYCCNQSETHNDGDDDPASDRADVRAFEAFPKRRRYYQRVRAVGDGWICVRSVDAAILSATRHGLIRYPAHLPRGVDRKGGIAREEDVERAAYDGLKSARDVRIGTRAPVKFSVMIPVVSVDVPLKSPNEHGGAAEADGQRGIAPVPYMTLGARSSSVMFLSGGYTAHAEVQSIASAVNKFIAPFMCFRLCRWKVEGDVHSQESTATCLTRPHSGDPPAVAENSGRDQLD